jgi:hypothetical protein
MDVWHTSFIVRGSFDEAYLPSNKASMHNPKLQMSDAKEYGSPITSSGLIYGNVPTNVSA